MVEAFHTSKGYTMSTAFNEPDATPINPLAASRSTGTTFQVLVATYEDYLRWWHANPGVKDPYNEYPSVTFNAIHEAMRKARLHHLATKSLDRQLKWATQRKLMVCRKSNEQHGFSGCVLTKDKGEPLYFKLAHTEIVVGCTVRDLLFEPANSKYWECLVVYAYLDNPRRDADIQEATGLSLHAIETARKFLTRGFKVRHPVTGESIEVRVVLRSRKSNTSEKTREWYRVDPTPAPLLTGIPNDTAAESTEETENTIIDALVDNVFPLSSATVSTVETLSSAAPAVDTVMDLETVCTVSSLSVPDPDGDWPPALQAKLEALGQVLGVPAYALAIRLLTAALQPLEEKYALMRAKKEEAAKAEADLKSLAQAVLP